MALAESEPLSEPRREYTVTTLASLLAVEIETVPSHPFNNKYKKVETPEHRLIFDGEDVGLLHFDILGNGLRGFIDGLDPNEKTPDYLVKLMDWKAVARHMHSAHYPTTLTIEHPGGQSRFPAVISEPPQI